MHELHVQAEIANDLGAGRVLGRFGAECTDATGAFQLLAPPEQRFALRKTKPDEVGEILPSRLIRVQHRAFCFGKETVRATTDRRRADEARFRIKFQKQPLNVIARQKHVGLSQIDING